MNEKVYNHSNNGYHLLSPYCVLSTILNSLYALVHLTLTTNLLAPFNRWRNWGLGKISNVPESQLINSATELGYLALDLSP